VSLSGAIGEKVTPIAPDNATGNYTKVVQRVAVKIVLDQGQKDLERLKVGMSAVPTINTASTR
jgi:membrane fusion protein (multidrug efflux system)